MRKIAKLMDEDIAVAFGGGFPNSIEQDEIEVPQKYLDVILMFEKDDGLEAILLDPPGQQGKVGTVTLKDLALEALDDSGYGSWSNWLFEITDWWVSRGDERDDGADAREEGDRGCLCLSIILTGEGR